VYYARMSVGEIFRTAVTEEFHSPLYYLLLHFWGAAFGWSEAIVRFPSVLLWTVAIVLFYRLCRMLLSEEGVAGVFSRGTGRSGGMDGKRAFGMVRGETKNLVFGDRCVLLFGAEERRRLTERSCTWNGGRV